MLHARGGQNAIGDAAKEPVSSNPSVTLNPPRLCLYNQLPHLAHNDWTPFCLDTSSMSLPDPTDSMQLDSAPAGRALQSLWSELVLLLACSDTDVCRVTWEHRKSNPFSGLQALVLVFSSYPALSPHS